MFINNQKRTSPACAQAWNLLYNYILEKKLNLQKFILLIGGANLKLSKTLGKNIINKSRLFISHVMTQSATPHNGCPTKIKKRKKNKGRNRRLKRFLNSTNKQLPITKGFAQSSAIILKNYFTLKENQKVKENLTKASAKTLKFLDTKRKTNFSKTV